MIVYGDRAETVRSADRLAEVQTLLDGAVMADGLRRHQALVTAFIDLAGLVQGVADDQFGRLGMDAPGETVERLMQALARLAEALVESWDSGFTRLRDVPRLSNMASELPTQVVVRLPEGFAHYALYPEAYAAAARRLPQRSRYRVIGLRSIGVGLAAITAAVLGAPLPVTLRPCGHPFHREVRIGPELAERLLDEDAAYVIVDEGPGLSGSSFGAVADWLEDHGVARSRIMFLPGHAGSLGQRASPSHARRWSDATRPVVSPDELLAGRLEEWVAAEIGPISAMHDISGGRWRATVWKDEATWPAINPLWERRKNLVHGGDKWLLRFAGLGRVGETKLRRAEALHTAGYGPRPMALLHGWLLEPWHGEAVPLTANELTDADLPVVADYLLVRTTMPGGQGASVRDLLNMAAFNLGQGLGQEVSHALEGWQGQASRLQSRVQPVAVDGRMLPHEWLRLPSGRLLKVDGLDHCASHDLVGCQDIAWDIAGFMVEFELDCARRAKFIAAARGRGLAVDPELLPLYEICYLAFRIGQCRMAIDMLADWPDERARNQQALERYVAKAMERLQRP